MDLKDHLALTLLPWQALIWDQWVPCISLGGLFKKWGFPFFQSVGSSPAYHSFSNMVDSGLGTSAASSLRTCSWISSGPVDLRTFRFLGWSQTKSSPVVGSSSFSQSLPLPPGTHAVQLEHLLVKAEAKTLSSISVFSISWVTWFPVSFQGMPTFF